MRMRFNVAELARKLGWTEKNVLDALKKLETSPVLVEENLIHEARCDSPLFRDKALIALAWLNSEVVQEGS